MPNPTDFHLLTSKLQFFAVVTASIVVFASFVAAAPGPEAADAAEVAVAADAEFSERVSYNYNPARLLSL